MDPALPAALRVAINLRLEGQAREGLARRAGTLSEGYRKGRASSTLVRGAEDALAYALTRTPATYAAVRRALGNLGGVETQPVGSHGFDQSITLTLPPLGAVFLAPEH